MLKVYGPNNVTWGTTNLGGPFDCHITATPFYNATQSTSSRSEAKFWLAGYGGNSKFISGHAHVKDIVTFATKKDESLSFPLGFQVADLAQYRIRSDGQCANPPIFNGGIFGLCNAGDNESKSELRANMLDMGLIESPTMSVFSRNAATTPALGQFTGEVLLGGVDTSAYVGDLVVLNGTVHNSNILYGVPHPSSLVINGHTISLDPNSNTLGNCLLDTGAAGDTWPVVVTDPVTGEFTEEIFTKESGLINTGSYFAYPGLCADIPANKTFDFTWPSKTGAKNITVKIPIRNYTRGDGEIDGNCALRLDIVGCVFGQTFLSAAYAAFDDAHQEIAFAQAGERAHGGMRIKVGKGEKLPGAVY